MPYQVAFVSLGCAKNLVNTEQMMALCRKAGFTVTGEPEGVFAPADSITWEQAAALAERYLDAAGVEAPVVQGGEAPDWVEATAHPWAVRYAEAAWRHGLLRESHDLPSAMGLAEGRALLGRLAECLQ